MKKLLQAITFVLCVSIMAGCSQEETLIYDIMPYDLQIMLVDEEGNNLLDKELEGNWIGQSFAISFEGETYTIDWDRVSGAFESRMVLPSPLGLTARPYRNEEDAEGYFHQYVLCFGDFQTESSGSHTFQFQIPGQNCYQTIELDHEATWKNGELSVTNTITLDGKEIKGNRAIIILPRRTNPQD